MWKHIGSTKERKDKKNQHNHIHTNHLLLFVYLTYVIFRETYKGSQKLELQINHKYVATNKNKYE